MPHHRPLGALERYWLAADDMAPPFAIGLVIEGTGDLTLDAVRHAVAEVVDKNPWLRAKVTGWLHTTRWTSDGNKPNVREFTLPDWDATSPHPDIPWQDPLPPRDGDTLSVWLIHGPTQRIIFRASHVAMDGRALWAFATTVGDSLNDKPLTGLRPPTMTDIMAAHQSSQTIGPVIPPSRHPFPDEATNSDGALWCRRTIPLPSRPILARVAIAVTRAAGNDEPMTVEVPVDLRPALHQENTGGNLTGIVRISIDSDNPDDVAQNIAQSIKEKAHHTVIHMSHPVRFMPVAMMVQQGWMMQKQRKNSGTYPQGATVSNLGVTDLSRFSNTHFEPSSGFWIPPGHPSSALLLIVNGVGDMLEMCASAPSCLGDNNRLERLMDRIIAGVMGLLLLLILSGPSAAQAATADQILAAFDTYRQHSVFSHQPLTRDMADSLASGDVVRIPYPSATEGVSGGMLALLLIKQPKNLVWIANQDVHMAQNDQTTEFLLATPRPHVYQWYGLLDLPFPFTDRHWVVESGNNQALVTASDNRSWEHHWYLVKSAVPAARAAALANPEYDVSIEMFDAAILTPTNHGAWVFLSVSPDSTLLGYFAESEIGGRVPRAAFAAWINHSTAGMLRDVQERATRVHQHYTTSHPILHGGDNKDIPRW